MLSGRATSTGGPSCCEAQAKRAPLNLLVVRSSLAMLISRAAALPLPQRCPKPPKMCRRAPSLLLHHSCRGCSDASKSADGQEAVLGRSEVWMAAKWITRHSSFVMTALTVCGRCRLKEPLSRFGAAFRTTLRNKETCSQFSGGTLTRARTEPGPLYQRRGNFWIGSIHHKMSRKRNRTAGVLLYASAVVHI